MGLKFLLNNLSPHMFKNTHKKNSPLPKIRDLVKSVTAHKRTCLRTGECLSLTWFPMETLSSPWCLFQASISPAAITLSVDLLKKAQFWKTVPDWTHALETLCYLCQKAIISWWVIDMQCKSPCRDTRWHLSPCCLHPSADLYLQWEKHLIVQFPPCFPLTSSGKSTWSYSSPPVFTPAWANFPFPAFQPSSSTAFILHLASFCLTLFLVFFFFKRSKYLQAKIIPYQIL